MRLRLQITKDAGIRFISHLEYAGTIARALRRAKLPVAYSEGFNPHMKVSLASALGVGITSAAEFVEIEVTEPVDVVTAMEQLNKAMPMGIRVVAGDLVDSKEPKLMASAAGADYEVKVPCVGDASELLREYNKATEVVYERVNPKNRRKTKAIMVKDFVPSIQGIFDGEQAIFKFTIAITLNGSFKATQVLEILKEQFHMPLVLEQADIHRVNIYGRNKKGKRVALLNN